MSFQKRIKNKEKPAVFPTKGTQQVPQPSLKVKVLSFLILNFFVYKPSYKNKK